MNERIEFESFDGTKLVGIRTSSLEGRKRRGVLFIHGLPSDKNEWGFYTDFAGHLLESSIVSFRFDFRHCGESEKGTLQSIGMSELVNDIEAAFWQLKSCLEPGGEVYLVATSAGGGVSIKWRNTFDRRIRQIFLMAPVLDYEYEVTGTKRLVQFDGHARLSTAAQRELRTSGRVNSDAGYGRHMVNDAHNFDFLGELRATQTPTLIFHGDRDTVVPIFTSEEAARAVSLVSLRPVPNCDHGFAAPGDDDLTDPQTKANHQFVYRQVTTEILSHGDQ